MRTLQECSCLCILGSGQFWHGRCIICEFAPAFHLVWLGFSPVAVLYVTLILICLLGLRMMDLAQVSVVENETMVGEVRSCHACAH